MEDRERIQIKTDDGYEIEAEVISKKKVEKDGPIQKGDWIVNLNKGKDAVEGNLPRQVVEVDEVGDFKIHDGWILKRHARLATSDEVKLATKYNRFELNLRDEFAKDALDGLMGQGYYDSVPRLAYKLAERMLETRRSIQNED